MLPCLSATLDSALSSLGPSLSHHPLTSLFFSCVPDSFFSPVTLFPPLTPSPPPPLIFLRPPPPPPQFTPAASSRPASPAVFCSLHTTLSGFFSTLTRYTTPPFNLKRLCIVSNNAYTVPSYFHDPYFLPAKNKSFFGTRPVL